MTWKEKRTLSTILMSEVVPQTYKGLPQRVLWPPTLMRANLQGAPSTCSVTPNSDVWMEREEGMVMWCHHAIITKGLRLGIDRTCSRKIVIRYNECCPLLVVSTSQKQHFWSTFWSSDIMVLGVFDLIAEAWRHLKEEEVALSALKDQSLGVPHLVQPWRQWGKRQNSWPPNCGMISLAHLEQ